jgi:serine/threonine-protein kinase
VERSSTVAYLGNERFAADSRLVLVLRLRISQDMPSIEPERGSTPLASTGPVGPAARTLRSELTDLPLGSELTDLPASSATDADALPEARIELGARLAPGTLVDGCYRLVSALGRGAMGIVMLAEDERLERRVAIKFIRDDLVDPGFQERFTLEARAMARVSHPNVLVIHAFGNHDGIPYFVTEFVEGVTLETWLCEQSKPIELATVLRILGEICHGVSAIHAAGTVHRDLKPSNILLDADLRARVADFGISTRPAVAGEHREELAGTPAYMAPELAGLEGRPHLPSPLSDVYALGCMAFELLTGQRPFEAHGQLAWIVKHASAPVPLPSGLRSDLPRGFDRVLLRALAKDPKLRTSSVEELRRDLTARALEPERILVAEDDPDFGHLLELTLQHAFPESVIECAADGRAALDILEECPASIALIDLSLPVLDGAALTSRIRQRDALRQMPIIVLTGRGGASEWQTLAHLGADRFLVKPVNLSDLVNLIRTSMLETFGIAARHLG